ncbi:hypothetical protein CHLRE_13g567100v5 [Chlamydomonas reinhardtii]|uniref:FAD-binding PCMH-type domain-containing protein n=1 Tax=Chlamydomonas reinhardtii TaxID=3055 RepID=A0A2K3CZE1_CHLRE|nr:uncharacterized protein CHLRE_13g567100v5 [Chlamydomonas reinhardtii]PNW73648.1 hypothetical protein CHLRE_13g567100v5 [Chlamydomonas reinhardtii]
MRVPTLPSRTGSSLEQLLRRHFATARTHTAADETARAFGRGAGIPGGGGPLPPNFGRPELSAGRRAAATFFRVFLPVSGAAMMYYAYTNPDKEALVGKRYPPELQYLAAQQTPNTDTLVNWSGTHEATPPRLFQPESESEVEAFLRVAARRGERLRPAGSGLSPNGAALSGEGVLALGGMDQLVSVDKAKMQVTVQAGVRVQQLADLLAPHGLTLQNYASIREQQIGGLTQVGAHGNGARIPPCDEQVVALRLATPGLGVISLSEQEEPELFRLARVSFGSLGVLTQATLRVVRRHQLIERTFTASPAEVKRNHVRWLQENKHIKYLYIPYTDTVVVVTANPPASPQQLEAAQQQQAAPAVAPEQRTEALRKLYASVAGSAADPDPGAGMGATALRDVLLAAGPGPLDAAWVAQVNAAEADYWRRATGTRVGWSDQILGFDCGGQQWVLEVAFQVAPSLDALKPGAQTRDLQFMDDLLAEIKKNKIAAASPLEVRWTSGSSSSLSPAAGTPHSLHCWVGVIMYLPPEPEKRAAVTDAFRAYTRIVETRLMPKYNAAWHWAKLEAGAASGRPEAEMAAVVRPRLAARYGPALAALKRYRAVLDPAGTCGSDWTDAVIGPAPQQGKPQGVEAGKGEGAEK